MANNTKQFHLVDKLWDKMVEKNVKPNANHFGHMAESLRYRGDWKSVIELFNVAQTDALNNINNHLITQTMATCREVITTIFNQSIKNNSFNTNVTPSWSCGLQVFSFINNKKLSTQVCTEAVKQFHFLSKYKIWPNSWKLSLKFILEVTQYVNYSTDLFNALITQLVDNEKYSLALSYIAKSPANLSVETFTCFFKKRGQVYSNSNKYFEILKIMENYSVQPNAEIYEIIFRKLHLEGNSEAAYAFFKETINQLSCASSPSTVGVQVARIEPFTLGFLDSLITHQSPTTALFLAEQTKNELECIIAEHTSNLCYFGESYHRLVLQGKICVADSYVIQSFHLHNLIYDFDSIIVPFSSVRTAIKYNNSKLKPP